MSFPTSPSTHAHELHDAGHKARSEESIPIGFAVDFADEMEFEMGMGAAGTGEDHVESSSSCPISPSTVTEFSALSPTQTNITTPPASPPPEPEPEPGPSWKGKGRAIPARVASGTDSRTTFQTPPDTSFGTPGAGGSSARGRPKTREEREREGLPSIMPLSPGPSPSPTPRPSRLRAISGLSFSSLRESIAHHRSRSRSGAASPSVEGTGGPKRKLSLKGLGALVKRKTKSRPGSGLSSEITSPASSAFQTPSSSLPRRMGVQARPSVAGVWEDKTEVVTRPVRGRAETAPAAPTTPVVVGDYFGFGFEAEETESDEPSREDSSDVVQINSPVEKPPAPRNPFGTLPRELHLLILAHLVGSYVSDHNRALKDKTWSASQAGSEHGKWHGEAAGLRAMIATARVSRTWHALAHDGTFWTRITYAALVPPRIGVPAITSWLPSALRHEAKASPAIEQLDAQDERVLRLVQAAGSCLCELDLRGWTRFGAADVKRVLGSITTP
ncbi:hypothetical protein FRC06_011057, partial [Ceratobasidium sp. 370]